MGVGVCVCVFVPVTQSLLSEFQKGEMRITVCTLCPPKGVSDSFTPWTFTIVFIFPQPPPHLGC